MGRGTENANVLVRIVLVVLGLFTISWGLMSLYFQNFLTGWTGEESRFILFAEFVESLPYAWALGGITLVLLGGYFLKQAYYSNDIFERYREERKI